MIIINRPFFVRLIRLLIRYRAVALILLLIVFGVVVGHQLSAPVHGRQTAVDIKPSKSVQVKSQEAPAATLDQPYFSLNLPPGYVPQAAATAASGQLYSQTIVKPASSGSLIIAIGIKNLPEGGLTEDPSYRLRTQDTARYSISEDIINNQPVKIINDSQAAVVVAFWEHDSYLATISVSSGIDNPAIGDNADSIKVLQVITHAWSWK